MADEPAAVGVCSGSEYYRCDGISRSRRGICLSSRVMGISVFDGARLFFVDRIK